MPDDAEAAGREPLPTDPGWLDRPHSRREAFGHVARAA